jgi:chaperonin cofactor prefoldin
MSTEELKTQLNSLELRINKMNAMRSVLADEITRLEEALKEETGGKNPVMVIKRLNKRREELEKRVTELVAEIKKGLEEIDAN